VSCAATALAISYAFTTEYKADVTLVPTEETLGTDESSLVGGLASLVGAGQLGSKESEALAILKSRGLIWSYMQENGLLPILFPNKWDLAARKWKSDKKSYVPTLEDGYRVFDKQVRNIVENRKTNVITVYITWRDPKLAKQWADGLVDAANELIRQQEIERSTNNLAYLQAASDRTSIIEVKNSIYKLMETEIKKQMIAMGNKHYAFRVVDPAVVPQYKSFPKHTYFAAFGAGIGATIWLLLVAFRDRESEPVKVQ